MAKKQQTDYVEKILENLNSLIDIQKDQINEMEINIDELIESIMFLKQREVFLFDFLEYSRIDVRDFYEYINGKKVEIQEQPFKKALLNDLLRCHSEYMQEKDRNK